MCTVAECAEAKLFHHPMQCPFPSKSEIPIRLRFLYIWRKIATRSKKQRNGADKYGMVVSYF